VEKAADVQPLALLCEGTRIDKDTNISEQEVRDKIIETANGKKDLIIANFPIRDTERYTSFLEAAKATDRKLAISTKQAYLLQELKGTDSGAPSIDDDNLAIYIRRKDWGLITKPEFPREIMLQDYDKWEREFIDYPNAVTCKDVSANQSDYILRLDFFELPELISIQPNPNSCYIRSVTEPI
jgi:ribonuclease J